MKKRRNYYMLYSVSRQYVGCIFTSLTAVNDYLVELSHNKNMINRKFEIHSLPLNPATLQETCGTFVCTVLVGAKDYISYDYSLPF